MVTLHFSDSVGSFLRDLSQNELIKMGDLYKSHSKKLRLRGSFETVQIQLAKKGKAGNVNTANEQFQM